MTATPPITFCVSELVNVVAAQAEGRTPWHLDEVSVSTDGESAAVSLLVDHYNEGLIRLDVSIVGHWVAPRRPASKPPTP